MCSTIFSYSKYTQDIGILRVSTKYKKSKFWTDLVRESNEKSSFSSVCHLLMRTKRTVFEPSTVIENEPVTFGSYVVTTQIYVILTKNSSVN